MAPQATRRKCQGDFAATVKEILPIDECKDVAASSSTKHISGKSPTISGDWILTGRGGAA
jgi:hypothetical protein